MKPMTPTKLERLASELAATRREADLVNRAVWGVAIGVMIYGAVNVYGLLVAHDVNPKIAWLLSPIVDLGLCAALWAGAGLARHAVPAGWVNVLRWVAGLMTWGLNIAGPLTHGANAGAWAPDWLGVGIHTCGPLLLLAVAEAAASYRHKMHKIIAGLEEQERSARTAQDTRHAQPLAPSAFAPAAPAAPVISAALSPVASVAPAALSPARPEDSQPTTVNVDRPGLSQAPAAPLSSPALTAGQDRAARPANPSRTAGQDSRPAPAARTDRSEQDIPPSVRTARAAHAPRPHNARPQVPAPAVEVRQTQAGSAVEIPVEGEAAQVADLLPIGREVAAELALTGRALSRPTLIEALRDRNVPIATSRAAVLTRVLKEEQAAATEPTFATDRDSDVIGGGQAAGQDSNPAGDADSAPKPVEDSGADSPEDTSQDRPDSRPRDSEDSTADVGEDSPDGPVEDSSGG